MRANYAACYSSEQDMASLSGWNGLFYFFFCAVREMALVGQIARNLSTLGDISDHQRTSDFTLKHIGRFEDAKL